MAKKIAILNKGKNTQIIRNKINGYDIGIQDEGENTIALENEINESKSIVQKWYEIWWVQYIILPLAVIIIGAVILFMLGL